MRPVAQSSQKKVKVVGQAGYYDVTYEITENGWDILYCDFYEEDDENIW